jgi:DNA repair exonuclease SbcCD nuclease subunit
MKFLHAADIHLDSPMQVASRREGAPVEALRGCTRRAFAAMIDLALAERVAFVVIAGDLYDGSWKDYGTGLYFAEQMARLKEVPCFVALGNHDAESVITRGLQLTLPRNVHLFPAKRPETVVLRELGVALHGRSFPERAVTEDISAAYGAPVPGLVNVGVLHTAADGRPGHEPYAPCTVAGLVGRGYDYWALGHVHQHEVLARDPDPWIVFPGNLQGRSARESGPKGCMLVEIEGDRLVPERRAVDVLRWAALEVAADGAGSLADLAARVRDRVADAASAAEGRPLAVRLAITGETGLQGELVSRPERFAAECRAAAAEAAEGAWIERVRLATRGPAVPAGGVDALNRLLASFPEALAEPAVREALLGEAAAILGRFPAEPDDAEIRALASEEALPGIVEAARALVAHRLAGRRPI